MRSSDAGTIAALNASVRKGIVPRSLITITARALEDGEPELFCFWNGVLPLDVEVMSGATGALEQRAFAADGAVVDVDRIRLTTDLVARPVSFRLNPLHKRVALMMLSYDVRLAPVEIHRGILDAQTKLLAGPPACRFLGFVETVPRIKPRAGGRGSLTFKCLSETLMLTRTNPLLRSDAVQQRRSEDRMLRYADVAFDWVIPWGEHEGPAQ